MSLEQFMNIKNNLLDKDCYDTIDNNPNMLVPWYLMAAYAYYVEDDPIITDGAYDKITQKLIDNWDVIDHFHKPLLSIDDLRAGTYLGEYPTRVKSAVEQLRSTL